MDLNVELIGENKFVCKNDDYSIGIYTGASYIGKDLAIMGDGSLTVELPNKSTNSVGIFADVLTVSADITVITSDCENMSSGIVCDSTLIVANNATITVNNGAGKHSRAVRVHNNAFFEAGTALNISVKPGSVESCRGFSINGDLLLGDNASVEVSIDDKSAKLSECICVTGLMDIGSGASVTASAKKAYAIESYGAIKANERAVVSAVSDKNDADIFCSGALINYEADIDARIDAIGGIRHKIEN